MELVPHSSVRGEAPGVWRTKVARLTWLFPGVLWSLTCLHSVFCPILCGYGLFNHAKSFDKTPRKLATNSGNRLPFGFTIANTSCPLPVHDTRQTGGSQTDPRPHQLVASVSRNRPERGVSGAHHRPPRGRNRCRTRTHTRTGRARGDTGPPAIGRGGDGRIRAQWVARRRREGRD